MGLIIGPLKGQMLSYTLCSNVLVFRSLKADSPALAGDCFALGLHRRTNTAVAHNTNYESAARDTGRKLQIMY